MKLYAKVNQETGHFEEDVLLEAVPLVDTWPTDAEGNPIPPEVTEGDEQPPRYIPDPIYVETPCPGGFFWPRWNYKTRQWEEGGTAPEPTQPELTDVEKLKIRTTATEDAIDGIMMILMGGMM